MSVHVARVAVLCTLAVAAARGDPLAARQSRVASERAPGPFVDFSAVQGDGTPVVDLLPSEVAVRVNDRPRIVRALRRVATGPAPGSVRDGAAARVPAPYGTNDSVAAGRRFVLVVDQESFAAGAQQLLNNAVEGLVSQLTPADQAMVVALPFGGVKMPFTSETARLRLAMASIVGQGARGETGSELACRTRRFLESLAGFLQTQTGRDAPLTVVLFTGGMAAPRRDAPLSLAPGMCELLAGDFRRVGGAAGAVRANFYVMQPADVGMSASAWRESIGGAGDRGSDNPLEGIEHLAGATGGARLPLDAAGTASLLRVARETSAFYEAELEPERAEILGRSRSLDVRVGRRGVIVRARPEIIFPETARRTAARLTVNDLLGSTVAIADLPLRIGGFTVRDRDARLRVGVVVEPADSAATLASAGAVLIGPDGQVVAHWFARDASERPLLGAMAAPPGTYRLRVAAISTDGRPGAAEDDVAAGLTTVGPLSLGSLILGVSRPEGMRPQLEFRSEPAAIASFDIYGGGPGMALTAALEVGRDLHGRAVVTVPLALKRADEGRVIATGAVPLGALAPGDYVVRGVIRLPDGTTGRVTRTLRKADGRH